MSASEEMSLIERESHLNRQLRDEIREENKDFRDKLARLEKQINALSETTQRFLAHFEYFKDLNQEFENKVEVAIKKSSLEVTEKLIEDLTAPSLQKLEDTVQNKIGISIDSLNSIIQQTEKGLSRRSYYQILYAIFLSLIGGISLGYYLFQPFNFGQYYKPTNRLETFMKG